MRHLFETKIISSQRNQFLILCFLTLFLHAPLLFVPSMENPDAAYIYPYLQSLNSPLEYLNALITLDTFDFQPVRDLTLFLDIWFFNLTGRTLSVFLNCLLWAGSCYFILRIIEEELAQKLQWWHFLSTCCFSVYPIFYQTVNWGIARKHLLAFFFLLISLRNLYRWMRSECGPLSIVIPYTLSVLSLPIIIGWPAWLFFKLKPSKVLKEKHSRNLIAALITISLLLIGINWAYYKTSLRFLEIYPQKASGFELMQIIRNLGLQVKQVVFPYELSFYYNINDFFPGLVLLAAFLIFLGIRNYRRGNIWTWPLLAVLPLIVTLSTPQIYYDPYVIIPAFAIFIFFLKEIPWFIERIAPLLIPLFFIWAGLTWKGNEVWGNRISFYERSFYYNPNCRNAFLLTIRTYQSGEKLSNALYDFIQINNCYAAETDQSSAMALQKLNVEALILSQEDEIDLQYRITRLRDLGSKYFYPMCMLATVLAKEGLDNELEEVMSMLNTQFKHEPNTLAYDFVFSEIVPKYCELKKLPECIKFSRRWRWKPQPLPYF